MKRKSFEKRKDQIAEKWEMELTLLGATAVEDKLQVGVPETIHDLLQASNHFKNCVLLGGALREKTSKSGC